MRSHYVQIRTFVKMLLFYFSFYVKGHLDHLSSLVGLSSFEEDLVIIAKWALDSAAI